MSWYTDDKRTQKLTGDGMEMIRESGEMIGDGIQTTEQGEETARG